MFTHIMVGASDPAAGKTFYDAVLGTLGAHPGREFRPRYLLLQPQWRYLRRRQAGRRQ